MNTSAGIIQILLILLFPVILFGQVGSADCDQVKNGTFYLYHSSFPQGFTIIRDNAVQIEIQNNSKDSSFWKVNWIDNCTVNLKFIRETQPITEEMQRFLNSHIVVSKVLFVTKNYYGFIAGVDSITNEKAIADTIWFKPK